MGSDHKIPIDALTIQNMIQRGSFEWGKLAIRVTSENAIVSIDLHLNDRGGYSQQYPLPISGFPRSLADAEPLKRIRKHARANSVYL